MRRAAHLKLVDESRRKPTLKFVFTLETLDTIRPPKHGRLLIHDLKCHGLSMQITASDARTWYLYLWHNGGPVKMKLGTYPAMTIKDARDRVNDERSKLNKGVDIVAERRAFRSEATLGELWEKYKTEHLAMECSPKTLAGDQSLWDNCLKDWAGRRVSSIGDADISAKHAKLGRNARGRIMANRALQLLKRMWNFGRLKNNPVNRQSFTPFKENERVRFLTQDESTRFFTAVNDPKTPEDVRDLILLALHTGARRGNVQAMAWNEISLPGSTWTIPPEKIKTDKPVSVHLSAAALEVLERRKKANDALEEPSPWVIPAYSASGHIEEPKKAWADVKKRAGLVDFHFHDLRHTLATWTLASGGTLEHVKKQLGHARITTTEKYAHVKLDQVRPDIDRASSALAAAAKGTTPPKAKVDPAPEPKSTGEQLGSLGEL